MKPFSGIFKSSANPALKTSISDECANRLTSLMKVCEGTEADVLKNSLRLLEVLAKGKHDNQPILAVCPECSSFEILNEAVLRDVKRADTVGEVRPVTQINLALGPSQLERLDKIKEMLGFSEYRDVFATALRVYEIAIEHTRNGGSFAHYKLDGTSAPIDIFED